VPEEDRLSLPLGQLIDGRHQQISQLFALQVRTNRRTVRRLIVERALEGHPADDLPAPEPASGQIARNPEQPAPKLSPCLIAPGLPAQSEKSLLADILRLLPRPEHPDEKGEHWPFPALDEHLERTLVAFGPAGHELIVRHPSLPALSAST